MSVYKEGYYAVSELQKSNVQIYPDACDYGVPVKIGDRNWNLAKQLGEWYGDKETRKVHKYSTGINVDMFVTLMDEWAVSDERKTVKEATETFHLGFTSCTTGKCKGYNGFITLNKIK
jgi:hypothetical protein